MKYIRLRPGCLGVIILEGILNRESLLAMKSLLLKSIGKEKHIVVNLKEVEQMDTQCYRLLCDAHRTSVALMHRLSVIGSRRDIFAETVRRTGFVRSSRCIDPGQNSCYWLRGQPLVLSDLSGCTSSVQNSSCRAGSGERREVS